jgi:hypothetical protein
VVSNLLGDGYSQEVDYYLTLTNWKLAALLEKRHLFLTEHGMIGMGLLASSIERGDIVVKLDHSDHYFALKPVNDKVRGRHYVFMGEVQFHDPPEQVFRRSQFF